MSRGRFITFEGLDGAGKTTQTALLEQWFKAQQLPYLRSREPGGTPLGMEIRRLLFEYPELTLTPLAEAFLFQADRAQHVSTVIQPALESGIHVISDRSFDSSIAYQGAARSVGEELVSELSTIAMQGLLPDLTLLLDLEPSRVRTRTDVAHDQSGLRQQRSRFDSASEHFHERLRASFLKLAHTSPERIKIIDAAQTPQQVHEQIVALVEPLVR